MKVLHLSTFDTRGGAARGAYWLHRALSARGVDSRMLVGRKYSSDPTVAEPREPFHRLANAVRGRLDAMPLARYRKTEQAYWTIGWQSNPIDGAVASHEPEIVHAHWTGGGFMSIESLRRLSYPVVWTLRDMWAFTGGCHYSSGCERFAEACGQCPQLRSSRENDLSRRMWHRKSAAWQRMNLWLVPISSWLADCVGRSSLFQDVPIQVIPNGIDTSRFRPVDRARARASWRLSDDKHHVLFGGIAATEDARKGFHHLVEAARILADGPWSESVELVVFGGATTTDFPDLGLPIRSVGYVSDEEALARLYTACDVMVVPSEQEAFGKTLVEAMACGVPVVAFASGGPLDIVDHLKTGFLAEPFSVRALADGIVWCLEDDDRRRALGRHARAKAERDFEIGAVAERYESLYRQILARKS